MSARYRIQVWDNDGRGPRMCPDLENVPTAKARRIARATTIKHPRASVRLWETGTSRDYCEIYEGGMRIRAGTFGATTLVTVSAP